MDIDIEWWLFWITLIAGLIWFFDKVYASRRRAEDEAVPTVIDYGCSFFPVLLFVFLLRSFLFEPFIIPSGSLEPTLLVGDFILVNKFQYGLRLPIIHRKVLSIGEPKRGDIMVFRWPPNPNIHYIKRVIGVPGDKVSYINKQLYINGNKIALNLVDKSVTQDSGNNLVPLETYREKLFTVDHKINIRPKIKPFDLHNIQVPPGYYFVLGDNRDDSLDGRYWGFMPEKNIVGKAVIIWMSWAKKDWHVRWGRLGSMID